MLFNPISCPGSKAGKTSDEAKKKVLDAINTKEREIWWVQRIWRFLQILWIRRICWLILVNLLIRTPFFLFECLQISFLKSLVGRDLPFSRPSARLALLPVPEAASPASHQTLTSDHLASHHISLTSNQLHMKPASHQNQIIFPRFSKRGPDRTATQTAQHLCWKKTRKPRKLCRFSRRAFLPILIPLSTNFFLTLVFEPK